MEKIIEIDGKDVKFKCNAYFPILYKNQFGEDILTVMFPILSEVLRSLEEITKAEGDLDLNTVADCLQDIYSLQAVDVLNLIWTLAKLGDENIPEPGKWYSSFNEFPIVDITMELAPIVIATIISKKKQNYLKDIMKPKAQ